MQPTRMTSAMGRSLQHRLSVLNARIEALSAQRQESESVDAMALLMQLSRERGQIQDALRSAAVIDDAPFDTHAIEVGDRVTVRDSAGDVAQYVLVEGSFSSRVKSNWVSVSSPLGAALLGRSVGDRLAVATPSGLTSYVILGFERASDLGDGDDRI